MAKGAVLMPSDTIMVRILREQGDRIDRQRFAQAAKGTPVVARDAWVREAVKEKLQKEQTNS
jgi:hypothetical protein